MQTAEASIWIIQTAEASLLGTVTKAADNNADNILLLKCYFNIIIIIIMIIIIIIIIILLFWWNFAKWNINSYHV